MPKSILPLLALLTAGCATTASLTSSKPVFEATTPRSVQQVAECLGSRWAGTGTTSRPIPGGYLFQESGLQPDNVVTVTASGDVTTVRAFHRSSLLIGGSPRSEILNQCLAA